MNWKQPVCVRKVRLFMLLRKLGVKMPDTLAFNEGDAFMNADGFDNGIYVVTRAGVLLIGSAGGGPTS
jgi:hypothetical protein